MVIDVPTLDWIGKDRVVDFYHQTPFRILNRIPSKGVLDSHGADCGNMVIHGDNIDVLKALLPEYEGRVDCIYIDPPYNTGNESWVYNDNVNDPRIRKWLGQVVGKEGEDLSRHDKWLCMMYPRLQLMRKMLKETGAIFISIGDDECASLKLICDEIFGTSCFQGDISWQRSYSPRNDKHGMPVEVEHLLVYSTCSNWTPGRLERTEDMDSKYKNPDGDSAPWRNSDASAPNANTHQGMVYAIQNPFTGEMIYPPTGRHWTYAQDDILGYLCGWCQYKLENLHDEERRADICGVDPHDVRSAVKAIVLAKSLDESRTEATRVLENGPWPLFFFSNGGAGTIARKTYLSAVEGKLPTNLWMYDDVGHTDEATKELKEIFTGRSKFPTVKPLRLIERILRIGCPENGLVLDAFAGSGTTGHAVLRENARTHANRRFILVEVMDYADSLTAERVRRAIRGYEVSKTHAERLYEKKLTASNLKNCQKIYEEALAVADSVPEGKYDKILGPKMDGSSIVVDGVTEKGETIPGIDSGFSYYELGETLFQDPENDERGAFLSASAVNRPLNPSISRGDIMRYVWYTETKAPYVDRSSEHPYLLGQDGDTVYYLAWEPDDVTTLSYDLLRDLPVRGTTTVIYADRCVLSQNELDEMSIRFRQVPRQIARI